MSSTGHRNTERPLVTILDAFGPHRFEPRVSIGERVDFPWHGGRLTGTVERIGPHFNGVEGIHAYASIRGDNSTSSYPAMVDELEPCTTPALPADGLLW